MEQPWTLLCHQSWPTFCMESFEKNALSSATFSLKIKLRYVDDTLVLWPHDRNQLDLCHEHLNSLHSQIQFKRTVDIDNKINFLDVVVKRTMKGFSTAVYKKPKHTDM